MLGRAATAIWLTHIQPLYRSVNTKQVKDGRPKYKGSRGMMTNRSPPCWPQEGVSCLWKVFCMFSSPYHHDGLKTNKSGTYVLCRDMVLKILTLQMLFVRLSVFFLFFLSKLGCFSFVLYALKRQAAQQQRSYITCNQQD